MSGSSGPNWLYDILDALNFEWIDKIHISDVGAFLVNGGLHVGDERPWERVEEVVVRIPNIFVLLIFGLVRNRGLNDCRKP